MNLSERKSVTLPEIALIGVTRGAIGFGAACYSRVNSKGPNGTCLAGLSS